MTCSNANPSFLGVSSNGLQGVMAMRLDSPCAGAVDQAGSGIGVGQRQSLLELGEHDPDRPCHLGVAVVGLFDQLAAGYFRRVATSPVVASTPAGARSRLSRVAASPWASRNTGKYCRCGRQLSKICDRAWAGLR